MTQVDLAAVAIVVRRLCTGLAVEVAAVVPLVGNRWGAPMLLAVGRSRDVVLSPARVLRAALVVNATAVVLAHNHLDHSGPSPADHALTRRLVAAGAVLGVPLSGHLVVGPGGWFDCFERPSTRRSYELAGAQDCASASGAGRGYAASTELSS